MSEVRKFKPVQIKWYDATRHVNGWSNEIDAKGANICYTWGHLYAKNKNITKIVRSYNVASKAWEGLLVIPTKTILDIKYLGEK